MKWSIFACTSALLGACGPGGDRTPVSEPDTRAATAISEPENPGGGPAGQTPAYGEPGGVPSQVQSARDGAGPSVGEGSGEP